MENDKQEQSEEDALELDKLEVSVKEKQAEKTVDPPDTLESPQALPKDGKPRWKSLISFVKEKTFLICTAVALLGGITILFFIPSESPPPQQGNIKPDTKGRIVYLISSAIGHGHHVDMKLSLPFKDVKERKALLKKLSKVKNELPSASRQPELIASINKRDLEALRQHAMRIISNLTGMSEEMFELEILSLD